MFGLFFLLLLVVPVVELYVIVQVADGIGVLETVVVLLLISLTGAWLVKREGLGLLNRVQRQLDAGQLPTRELVDGLIILVAGALLLTPGFVTDAIGLLLLLPPVRVPVRALLLRRFRDRVRAYAVSAPGFTPDFGSAGFGSPGFGDGRFDARVYDVHDVREEPRRDDPSGPTPQLPPA